MNLTKARARAGVSTLALVVLSAVMTAASAIVHLHLWDEPDGYRAVPTIGPLFLGQGIVGCVLAVLMVAFRRAALSAAAAVYNALSIGGLVISINIGLFGYPETLDAPFVKESLVVEAIGMVAGAAAFVLALRPRRRGPA